MARSIAVCVAHGFPEEVVAILESAPLKVDANDLLPILAEKVGINAELLHGYSEHDDLGEIANATRLLQESSSYIRAVDLLRRWENAEWPSLELEEGDG